MCSPKILAPALLFAATSLALGINCRGSGLCPLATFEHSEGVAQGLRDGIYTSKRSNNTLYNSGDHVICVSSSLKINIGGVLFNINGNIGTGGICVFPQYLKQPVTFGAIKSLADALLQHGCTTCGSVPIHFVDQKSNDPDNGILTFNYVGKPICIGTCISAADDGNLSDDAPASTVTATRSPAPASTVTAIPSSAPASTVTVTPSSSPASEVSPTAVVTQTLVVTSPAVAATDTCAAGSSSTVTIVLSGTNTLFPGTTIISTVGGCAASATGATSRSLVISAPSVTSATAAAKSNARDLAISSFMTFLLGVAICALFML